MAGNAGKNELTLCFYSDLMQLTVKKVYCTNTPTLTASEPKPALSAAALRLLRRLLRRL